MPHSERDEQKQQDMSKPVPADPSPAAAALAASVAAAEAAAAGPDMAAALTALKGLEGVQVRGKDGARVGARLFC